MKEGFSRAAMEVFLLLFLSLALRWGAANSAWADGRLISPSRLEMFVDELPDMPRVQGFDITNGVPVSKTLKIGMYHKRWKFHRDLPATGVFAYGTSKRTATVPGPTIEALHGIETHVTWQNHLPPKHILPWDPTIPTAKPLNKGVPTVVHLHGAIGEPQSDGNSKAWFTVGFKDTGPTWSKKTYRYYNLQQPGNLWYHDHAMGLTRVNLLAGLIGAYIIRHPQIETPLGLPYGNEFDRPLVIFDRSFRTDGSLYMNSTGNNPSIHPQWQPEYFGDVIIVNGKAWPRLTVRRRKYRFRIINASNARFLQLFLTNGMRFIHVGSDSVYRARPVMVKKLLLAPSEIADVVFDFSKSTSNSVILANNASYPYPSGDPTDEINGKVMKFVIKGQREVDTYRVPAELIKYPAPDVSSASTTRYIAMYEYTSNISEPTHLYINGRSYEEPATEMPRSGSTEIWNVINLTEDNHPLHIHLGLFVTLDQTELVNVDEFRNCMTKMNDAVKCQVSKYARGKQIRVPMHERGWKNVFKMRPGCLTRILIRFSLIHSNASYPFDATAEPGYVYHCHILDHEDNVMMRPLKIIS
ncbi:multicopper oxidase LPR1-like [Macadamia integrifolia]|uniref:multicopper oxidase LPR1-like n=1 Tax=Macadamia integrifolia TaxID=60698 RepID=UPI001C4EFD79|nr:multicopper oxidase LPR1-like [Macadamia integrifolia]